VSNLLNAERLTGKAFLERLEQLGFPSREAYALTSFLTDQAHSFRRASEKLKSKWSHHTHGVGMILEVNATEEMIVGVALERDVNEFFVREIGNSATSN
jgi:hypothetical protein